MSAKQGNYRVSVLQIHFSFLTPEDVRQVVAFLAAPISG